MNNPPTKEIFLCPFCARYKGSLINDHKFHVECPNCNASGPYTNTEYYAIHLWNVVSHLLFKENKNYRHCPLLCRIFRFSEEF